MRQLFNALLDLQTPNPLGLPIDRTGRKCVPVPGTNIRAALAYQVTDRDLIQFGRNLGQHPKLRFLEGVRHCILRKGFEHRQDRDGFPLPPQTYWMVIYDYTGNRALRVKADFPRGRQVEVEELKEQPVPSEEEWQEAFALLAAHPKYGERLRSGRAFCSPGMPPVLDFTAPTGTPARYDGVPIGGKPPEKRTLSVVMHYRDRRGSPLGVFHVNMVDQVVDQASPPGDFLPAGGCGGPPSGGGCASPTGTGAWIEWPQTNPVWRAYVIRPRDSAGNSGSGIEIQSVDYRGKRVLRRGMIPVLNVFYENNSCGPYCDWLNSETCFECTGTDVIPCIRWGSARVICDTGSDAGNFRGVGIYETGNELVMISECSAGWYRYVTSWRLQRDGILRPRFLYGYTESGCVCYGRQHNAYWRLDLDLNDPNGTLPHVVEETENPFGHPHPRWELIRVEGKRFRRPGRDIRWRVRNLATGEIAEIIPGPEDGYAHYDRPPFNTGTYSTGKGDLWVLKYKTTEETTGGGCVPAGLDNFANRESVVNQNVVLWYAVHLKKQGADEFHCPPLGPDIVLKNW